MTEQIYPEFEQERICLKPGTIIALRTKTFQVMDDDIILLASPTKRDAQESSQSPQSHSPKKDSTEARIQNLEEFLGGLASRLQLTLKHPLVWHQSHSPLEGCLLSLLINIQHHAQNTLEKMDATTEEKTDQNHSGDQDHQGEHQEESEEFRDLAKKVGLVEEYLSDNPMYVRPKK
jgi:hypothetical protein